MDEHHGVGRQREDRTEEMIKNTPAGVLQGFFFM